MPGGGKKNLGDLVLRELNKMAAACENRGICCSSGLISSAEDRCAAPALESLYSPAAAQADFAFTGGLLPKAIYIPHDSQVLLPRRLLYE
jgi:hypothetical protein